MGYLENLAMRLALGATALPEATRARHADWLLARQRGDGGFAGRKGGSDAYYTGFALRSLAMLGRLEGQPLQAAARYLESLVGRTLPGVDFLTLVYSAVLLEAACGVDVFARAGCDRRQAMLDYAAPLRRADGGYAKTPTGGMASTYHTMLTVVGLTMVGADVDAPEIVAAMLRSRQRGDGGFVELAPLKNSGTSPTAAAIAALLALDGLNATISGEAARYLRGMQTAEGGFAANTQLGVADLLSTFTALVTLGEIDAEKTCDRAAARRFALAMEEPQGGFRAAAWDREADVEYTFYGLGSLALLDISPVDDL